MIAETPTRIMFMIIVKTIQLSEEQEMKVYETDKTRQQLLPFSLEKNWIKKSPE